MIPSCWLPSVPAVAALGNVGGPGTVPAAEKTLPGLKLACEIKNGMLDTYYANLAWLANTLYDKGLAIYKSAEAAIDSLDGSRKKLEDVKDKMQDGRDSFLGKLNKMEKDLMQTLLG